MSESHFSSGVINLFNLVKVAIVLIVLAILFIVFLGLPLPVNGQSMEPNFHTGQVVLIQRFSYNNASAIRRGDVVAAKFPADSSHTRLIKRVLGLPGDTIHADGGNIYLNGQLLSEPYLPKIGTPPYTELPAITLKDNEYFLVGDNRPGSSDSRLWGPVQKNDIEGRISFVVWPFGQAQYIDRISY